MVTAIESQTPLRRYDIEQKVLEQVSYLESLGHREAMRRIRGAPNTEYQPEAVVLLARHYMHGAQRDVGWSLLAVLAQRMSHRVRRLTERMLPGVADRTGFCDDLVRDLMTSWSSMEPGHEFWAVRFYVAFDRKVTSLCKRERSRLGPSLDERYPGDADTVGDRLAASEAVSLIDSIAGKQALMMLSEKHRQAFVLRYRDQLSELEIADLLGVTDRTVRNYLRGAEIELTRWRAGNTRIPT
jgi:RNA polymerase sigma factor (sigma-70 family)